jgi:putative FmdB family regulatory protein
MPTYEYVCTACGNDWEEIQKISEAPLQVCPKCGKSTAKRQISGGNFILKGGGWYADLYSSSSGKGGKGEKGGSGGETKSEGSKDSKDSGSGKTDTAKTETKPSGGDGGGSSASSTSTKPAAA